MPRVHRSAWSALRSLRSSYAPVCFREHGAFGIAEASDRLVRNPVFHGHAAGLPDTLCPTIAGWRKH